MNKFLITIPEFNEKLKELNSAQYEMSKILYAILEHSFRSMAQISKVEKKNDYEFMIETKLDKEEIEAFSSKFEVTAV